LEEIVTYIACTAKGLGEYWVDYDGGIMLGWVVDYVFEDDAAAL
jgi:hypothetical protein